MTKKKDQEQQPERYDALAEFKKLKELAKEYGIDIPLKAGFTPDDINAVMPLLRYQLSDDALQESLGSKTGKGYDTLGYSYQAHIDRMNWVFGPTNWKWEIKGEQVEEGQTSGQYPKKKFTVYGEIVVEIGYKEKADDGGWYWVAVHQIPPYPTDHESLERGSARKGMLTKGLKRATSTLGVGADAWLGIFDDDLITGAEPGDSMASPAGPRRGQGPDDPIGDRDFGYLQNTFTRKGFTPEHFQTWMRDQTDGRIDKQPQELTNAEFEEAKKLLFTIPQGKTIHDMPDAQERAQERPNDPPTTKDTSKAEKTQESETQNASGANEGEPTTLEQLIACDETKIRELAAKHKLNAPAEFTATNRKPFCKALAAIMKIS